MLATALLALSTIGGCAADPDGRALLTGNRTAMAGAAATGTRVARYDYRAQDLAGAATITFDVESGRFTDERTLGITSGANGFDGTTAWTGDLAGFYSRQRGGDKVALAVNEAYRLANAWWRTDAGGAHIQMLSCSALRVTPALGKPFEAWFDPATHLLERVREEQSWHTVLERRFSRYDTTGGQMSAHRIEAISNDDESSIEILELTALALSAPRAPREYAMPANHPDDGALPATGRAEMPFRLLNNHVIVNARVNGKGPFPFLVDTGGHNILTPVTAAALGIRSAGSAVGGGSGEATTLNGYARVATLEAGGARMNDLVMLTLDFSPPAVEGLILGGMLGSEFLERFVVEIDYGRKVLTFIDAQRFDRRRAGTALPMNFYDHMPQVTGAFEGMSARFNLDTGSRSDVSISSAFVERAGLRARYPDGSTVTDGWGSGGPARSHVVRAGRMSLGTVEVAGPIAGLSVAKRGVMADDNFEGNVGSGLLKRFAVTFDYPGETLYLRRLQRPDPDTGRFDRTGMWINLAWGGMRVMDVAAGGPASAGGLEVGDLLTTIGDQPLATRTLSDVRRMLKLLPAGEPVLVGYRRGNAAATTRLVPRNLIPE